MLKISSIDVRDSGQRFYVTEKAPSFFDKEAFSSIVPVFRGVDSEVWPDIFVCTRWDGSIIDINSKYVIRVNYARG